jgi:hypothetical protein
MSENLFSGKLFFKSILILVIFIHIFAPNTHGQKSELGFFFGTSYYMGDLNPEIPFSMPQIAAGALYRFNINENLAIRLNGMFGRVASDDAIVGYNTDRNLRFQSRISELSLQGEVNFLYYIPGDVETPYTPYIFGGGGVFSFNPQADINGVMYNLQGLNTEGQGSDMYPDRKPYSITSFNYLFGIGFKFNITRQLTSAFEWGMRRTGTDYLDDVSTTYPHTAAVANDTRTLELYDRSLTNRGQNAGFARGNPNNNDWYSFAGIVLTFRIKDLTRAKCPAYN